MRIISKRLAVAAAPALMAALLAWPSGGALASGSLSFSGNQITYTCDDADDDVANINAAIASASGYPGGGIVNLASGTCLINQPISFQSGAVSYPNVWLRGTILDGVPATLLQRTIFVLSTPMVQANLGLNSLAQTETNSNIKITDLVIDPGILGIVIASPAVAAAADGMTISYAAFPPSVTAPNSDNVVAVDPSTLMCPTSAGLSCVVGVGLFDFSQPGVPTSSTSPHPNFSAAITLMASGNLTSVLPSGSSLVLQLYTDASIGLPVQPITNINVGETLVFYSAGGNVEISYVNGVTINNLTLLHGSAVDIDSSTNFVVSNSNFWTDDDFTTFNCSGGLNVTDYVSISDYGYVVNNTFINNGISIGSSDTVVSNNDVTGNTCGSINSGTGQYDIFQSNVVHNALISTIFGNFVIDFMHDYIINAGMQITNGDSVIAGNLIYNSGASGIVSRGSNNVIAGNTSFDNARSAFGQSVGASGIFLQAPSNNVNVNTFVTGNLVCNTGNSSAADAALTVAQAMAPACIVQDGANAGSQVYALNIFSAGTGVLATNIGSNNAFFPGSTGVVVQNGSSASHTTSTTLPEAKIWATPASCAIAPNGACTVTINWSSTNTNGLYIYVSNSAQSPSFVEVFASGASGQQQAPWIGNAIYEFRMKDSAGVWLGSVTVQPSNYSGGISSRLGNQNVGQLAGMAKSRSARNASGRSPVVSGGTGVARATLKPPSPPAPPARSASQPPPDER